MQRACRTMGKLLLPALVAGMIFFGTGFFCPRLPAECSVGGTDVSGMTLPQARSRISRALREEAEPFRLTVKGNGRDYVFRAPELYLRADVEGALARARKEGGAQPLEKHLALTDFEGTLRRICDDHYKKSADAKLVFQPQEKVPFAFERERAGCVADGKKLREDVLAALAAGGGTVRVYTQQGAPRVTERQLRQGTRLLSVFSTNYADGNNRSRNVALAASRINGTVLGAGENFSFNAAVGKRTRENGFLSAPVILEGKYVQGVGGGVCQVSTTLYNAALLAGLKVREVHAHSLSVGYVEPSFDAMVSDSCDLRLYNDTGAAVYLLAVASGGKLTVRVYGTRSGYTYERCSVVVETLSPPAPRLVKEGERERAEKAGLRSEGYLIRRGKDGETKVRLRTDTYAPIQGVVSELPQFSDGENPPDSLHLFVKCAKIIDTYNADVKEKHRRMAEMRSI